MVAMARVYPPAGQLAQTAAALDTAAATAQTPYAVMYNPDEGGSFLVTSAVAAAASLPGGATVAQLAANYVAAPTIAGAAAPTSGTVGATVTLTTTGATAATKILIGGVTVNPASVNAGGTTVTFLVPNLRTGATTIAIVTEGGTSGTTAFTVS